MRQHLIKFHKAAAEHHRELAKAHAERSSAAAEHADLVGPDQEELRKYLKSTAAHHDTLAGIDAAHAAMHKQMCKALEARGDDEPLPRVEEEERLGAGGDLHGPGKAAGLGASQYARGHDALVHGVIGDNQNRLVARPGGPPIDTEQLDPEMKKLVGK